MTTTHRSAATGPALGVTVAPPRGWEGRVIVITVLVVGLALSGVVLLVLHSKLPATTVVTPAKVVKKAQFPVGVVDPGEPSGLAPPSASAMKGYHLSYVTDFGGTALPPGWSVFTGKPGGVPNGQFAASHVLVGGGMLRLVTYRDPAYGNDWTTGGLCQCGNPVEYGAFFVRSRITGAGPNEVELLWPLSNNWPPEVDFNETGDRDTSTSWTQHYGADNSRIQGILHWDMTKWTTWGVIWTPTTLTFTVNGHVWGTVGAGGGIPHVLMTLDLEQRPACLGPTDCVASNQSMLVDWVAEYQRN